MRAAIGIVFFLLAACASGDEPDNAEPGPGPGKTGGMCGGIAGVQCETQGDYCAMEMGACRTTADAAGVCTPRPGLCTMEYRPVCGCDGETYSNACAAAAAGASVAYGGECRNYQ